MYWPMDEYTFHIKITKQPKLLCETSDINNVDQFAIRKKTTFQYWMWDQRYADTRKHTHTHTQEHNALKTEKQYNLTSQIHIPHNSRTLLTKSSVTLLSILFIIKHLYDIT